MSGCSQTGLLVFLSSTWVKAAVLMWGEAPYEKARKAKILLFQSIKDIQRSSNLLTNELKQISDKIRQLDRRKNMVTITNLVKRARAVRLQQALLDKKKAALEIHMDALASTELNQSVVRSFKETNSALKSMGLNDIQQQTDDITLDMEENLHDISQIHKLLSGMPEQEDIEWSEVEAELESLLSGNECAPPPKLENKMSVNPAVDNLSATNAHEDTDTNTVIETGIHDTNMKTEVLNNSGTADCLPEDVSSQSIEANEKDPDQEDQRKESLQAAN